MQSRYDVVLVGARCAGASTALLLARAGLRVLVVDRAAPGSDTLSTHALMRAGVLQLHRWGLLGRIAAAGTPAVRTTTFHYGEEAVEIAIKARDGFDALYAPRRTVLDAVLADAARAAGADVVYGLTAIDLERNREGRVAGVVLRDARGEVTRVGADLVVGADGRDSRVARLAEARVERNGRNAAAVVYGYFDSGEDGGFHWHYVSGASAGIIPTNDRRTCVFVAMPATRYRGEFGRGLAALHRRVLAEALGARAPEWGITDPAGAYWPFPGRPGFLRRAHGPGWALVGDAGAFRDPITAHGITDALRDAEILSRSVVRGGDDALRAYQGERDAMAIPMMELSDEIASFTWDLDRVKLLHLELSRLMTAEVDRVRGFGEPASALPDGLRRGSAADRAAPANRMFAPTLPKTMPR